jgi:hypothetical protein
VPLLLPMLALTVTAFLVPFKLASNASASNANRLAPVGLIVTFKAAPSITPRKVNGPNPVPLKEPGGMVVAKVPIWRVTGSLTGLIPLLVLPKVKLELKLKGILVWRVVEVDLELGAEGAEGDVRNNAHPKGLLPYRNRGHHRVGGRVDHRDIVGASNRDVGVLPIRGDGGF